MNVSADDIYVFRACGAMLVLDLSGGALPEVLHWGADLGELTEPSLQTLRRGGVRPHIASEVDEPVRVSLLPEHARGWMGTPGISGSRGGRDWSPLWERVSHEVVRSAGVDGPGGMTVFAIDESARLGLTLVVELTASGVVRTRATLRNEGSDEYGLDALMPALPVPADASELLDFAGRWAGERAPQRAPFNVGTYRREGRRGRRGLDATTLLFAATPGYGFSRGEVWGVHAAWSGNHVHQAERMLSGEQLLSGGELLLSGEVRLATGEEYTSPWLYGVYGSGLDDAATRVHDMLRARPQHPVTPRPVTLNVWEAVYFDHDLATLLPLADEAAAIGIERYVLDDGWFGARRNDQAGLGDWVVSSEVWPEGLHPLIDRVHELGMQFGLWFEPEMVNLDSDVARAHPEWIMHAGDRLPPESRHQQVLNLAHPDCYTYIRDSMCRVLDEYRIDYIKWDHNRDLVDAGGATGAPGVHAQTLAFYRLVDELKERYPSLEIESCSSGGGRIDLEVIQRTDRVWVSDNNDPHERQSMNRWTTQLLPLELMGTHVASARSHTTDRTHPLSFRAITALFGHMGVEWNLMQESAKDKAELAEWIALHKQERALLHTGRLVRGDHPDESLFVTGVVGVGGDRALYSVAMLERRPTASPGRVRLPGLAPGSVYRLEPLLIGGEPHGADPAPWWSDGPIIATGAVLSGAGVMMPALRPDQAVLLRAVREG